MAMVDADYKFLYVDVGAQGRVSDAGVFNNCKLSHKLEHDLLRIPPASMLLCTEILCPYMIVGDDAFPLKTYLMKPYSRRGMVHKEIIFNYRLSRCRRVVENAFGQLANRFRIFRTPIILLPQTAKKVVLACCALHNYLKITDRTDTVNAIDTDTGLNSSLQTNTISAITPLHVTHGRHSKDAKDLRDKLADYFIGSGRVEWQERMIGMANINK